MFDKNGILAISSIFVKHFCRKKLMFLERNLHFHELFQVVYKENTIAFQQFSSVEFKEKHKPFPNRTELFKYEIQQDALDRVSSTRNPL